MHTAHSHDLGDVIAAVELSAGEDAAENAGNAVRGEGIVGELVEDGIGVLVVTGADGAIGGKDTAQEALICQRRIQVVQQQTTDRRVLLPVLMLSHSFIHSGHVLRG